MVIGIREDRVQMSGGLQPCIADRATAPSWEETHRTANLEKRIVQLQMLSLLFREVGDSSAAIWFEFFEVRLETANLQAGGVD